MVQGAAHRRRVKEKKVPIIYVSAYGNTAAMAKKVAEGVAAAGLTPVLMNAVEVPTDRIVDELDESVGFLIGTPTLNSNLPHPILSLIGHLVVLNLGGKPLPRSVPTAGAARRSRWCRTS